MEIGIGGERQLPIFRLIFAFIIANVLFALVFSIANSFTYLDYQKTTQYDNLVANSLKQMDSILSMGTCSPQQFVDASNLLDVVGGNIALLEKRVGKNNENLLELKKIYTGLELKHYLLVNRFDIYCNAEYNIIFFFYSNLPENTDASDRIGHILDTLKAKYPKNIMIYSFDSNLDYAPIKNLMISHNITIIPSIVINNNQTMNIKYLSDIEPMFSKGS